MAQWFMNYSRWQLAIDHAEDPRLQFPVLAPVRLALAWCYDTASRQDALEILRAAPKPSASQELRALQILSQAHQGKGDKTGTDAVHESLKRFQQTDNRSAEAPALPGQGKLLWGLPMTHAKARRRPWTCCSGRIARRASSNVRSKLQSGLDLLSRQLATMSLTFAEFWSISFPVRHVTDT